MEENITQVKLYEGFLEKIARTEKNQTMVHQKWSRISVPEIIGRFRVGSSMTYLVLERICRELRWLFLIMFIDEK